VATGAAGRAARRPRLALRELVRRGNRSERYLKAALLALDPALVHFGSPFMARPYLGILHALRAKVVVSLTGDDAVLAFENPRLLESILGRAHGVHVECEPVAELLGDWTPADARVIVVPPAPDELLLDQTHEARSDGPLRILGIGPLAWADGYEHALRAVAALSARGVDCVYRIVGRGDFEEAVAFARYQLGLDALVQIVEPAGRAALREHLAWADVVLTAAVATRSPRTLVDAQAAGLAVVTTEAEAPGDASLVVPRRDPEALTNNLARLAADEPLRRRLGAAGRRHASASSGVERLVRLAELYDAVA
jgi:glycosyltransferase involved in cell wall biosynthesis